MGLLFPWFKIIYMTHQPFNYVYGSLSEQSALSGSADHKEGAKNGLGL